MIPNENHAPRRVLVTGGSGSIGSEIVRLFSKNGDTVAFLYSKNEESARALSLETGAVAIKSDLSTSAGTKAAAKKASELLSGVDILVNCAGISKIKLFTDTTDDEISELINVNLISSVILARELAPSMISNKYGRIINIGSMWGERGASCEVIYSTAKAGMRGFTKSLAKELGPSGITVNCVEPGFIDTPMNASLGENFAKEIINSTPIGRLGTQADVASLVLYIASDSAEFITAQCIGVDGGIIL